LINGGSNWAKSSPSASPLNSRARMRPRSGMTARRITWSAATVIEGVP